MVKICSYHVTHQNQDKFVTENKSLAEIVQCHCQKEKWCISQKFASRMNTVTNTGPREKSFKCNHCDYASAVERNLKLHLKRHSGERAFKCNQCHYASSYPHHLKRHLKSHSGEKAFKCDQCQYAFVEASELKRHLKTHSARENCTNAINVTMHLWRQAI